MGIPDLENKSADELLDLLANPDKIDELAKEPPAEPEPEAPAAPTPEPEPEEAPTPEPQSEPEEPELTVEVLDSELLRRRLEHAEAEAKRFEQLAGRNAGELGFVKNKVRDLERAFANRQPGDSYEAEEVPESEAKASTPDPVTAYVVSQAVPAAVASFEMRHPDSTELADGMLAWMGQNNINIGSLAQGNDPAAVAAETERILSSAYDAAKSAKRESDIAALQTKRAEMFERLNTTKRSASASASGSSAPPQPKPKTLDDLSEKELMAELQRALRG